MSLQVTALQSVCLLTAAPLAWATSPSLEIWCTFHVYQVYPLCHLDSLLHKVEDRSSGNPGSQWASLPEENRGSEGVNWMNWMNYSPCYYSWSQDHDRYLVLLPLCVTAS